MRANELHPDVVSDDIQDGSVPAEFQSEFRDEQEWRRQRQELIHALRNFAKHFGSAEVYQQAKVIYLESPAGQAEIEKAEAASFDAVLRDANRAGSDRQKRNTSGPRKNRDSPALANAKRALGG